MLDEITVSPSFDTMNTVSAFLRNALEQGGISDQIGIPVLVCFDEIFSNIVKFSGAAQVTISCGVADDTFYLQFVDDGVPFDPLAHGQVDIDVPFDERPIGGLGIFMVKESADILRYAYQDQKNTFTIGYRLTVK